MKQFKEKRKTQRLNIPVSVKYRILKEKGIFEETLSRDISGGGLRFRLRDPIKKGEKLKTLLHFPREAKPVTAFSKVTRCDRRLVSGKPFYDIGMKYVKINPKDREYFVFRFCEMMINRFMKDDGSKAE